jgi:hypothetical protein
MELCDVHAIVRGAPSETLGLSPSSYACSFTAIRPKQTFLLLILIGIFFRTKKMVSVRELLAVLFSLRDLKVVLLLPQSRSVDESFAKKRSLLLLQYGVPVECTSTSSTTTSCLNAKEAAVV